MTRGGCACLAVVVHRVGVSEYSAPADDETAGGAAVLPLPLPGQAVVGLAVHTEHLQTVPLGILLIILSHDKKLQPQ